MIDPICMQISCKCKVPAKDFFTAILYRGVTSAVPNDVAPTRMPAIGRPKEKEEGVESKRKKK